MSQPSTAAELFAPIAIIAIGIAFGIVLAVPSKKDKTKSIAAGAGWAISSGIAMWVLAAAEYQLLANFALFNNFSQLLSNTQYSKFVLGDVEKTAVATLIGLYEIGFMTGFLVFSSSDRGDAVVSETRDSADSTSLRTAVFTHKGRGSTGVVEIRREPAGKERKNDIARQSLPSSESVAYSPLDRDERTVVELFLFGNAKRIVPKVDVTKPEGYYFEGAPSIKLDTGRLRQLLDTLVHKDLLSKELEDKLLLCKECGSPNLQLKSMCPECQSMRLGKHMILEHFSCGLIDKQESFRTPAGDLVCPKCNTKLHLVGSDYRNLSQMYICSECNGLNKDLLQLMKCGSCGTVSQVGEENEEYLCSYSLNENRVSLLVDQIKPIEACTSYFRSQGYVVVAPAFVSGKSGTRHTFDMLVLDPRKPVASECAYRGSDNRGTVVEILVSSSPIEIAEITRVYGKVCDVDCGNMIFAIPALTDDARHYAEKFEVRVLEGESIEEALNKSKLATIQTERVPG